MKYILAASDNKAACRAIHDCFTPDYQVDVTFDKQSCVEKFQKRRYEFTFIDVAFLKGSTADNGHNDYRRELQLFWQAYPTAEIIVMAPQEKIRDAVNAVKAGASNYLTYPIDPHEVRYVAESIYEGLRMQSELDYHRDLVWESDSFEYIQTYSPAMKEAFDKVRSVAPTKSTVLLVGETGTGKGVLARLIHRHGTRSHAQFISVHCGAIPDTLLESELFGHEKGAFTGATRRKLGKFEIAHGGTIFLDEIGTITPSAQIKLLQVLQDKNVQRVGGETNIEVDVRIIAATNTDLKKMCDVGLFRTDLYYRLSVFPIEIPPLRDRIDDIPLFVDTFLKRLNKFYPKQIHDAHPQVLEAFQHYSWPGNIRELENLIERAYILEGSSILTPESFPSELFNPGGMRPPVATNAIPSLSEARRRGVETIEHHYLKDLLAHEQGRISATAKIAGITVRQLHKLMKKYALRKEDFKIFSAPHKRN